MATDAGISRVLAFLHELFPTREIGSATLDAWALVFADWTDADLQACAIQCAKEPGRTFFPSPGEIAACRPAPPVAVDLVLHRIQKLGHYDPNVGWINPTPETVRAALGDGVADAYAVAGSACFANVAADGTSITRDLARRTFGKELARQQQRALTAPLLPAPRKALTP